MLDQIQFTQAMLDLERLHPRYLALAGDVTGDEPIERLVDHMLRHGGKARGDAELVLRTGERTARSALRCALDADIRSRLQA